MMATPRCKMSPCRRYSPAPLACASSVSNAEQKPYLQMKKQAAVMQQLYTHIQFITWQTEEHLCGETGRSSKQIRIG